MLILYKSSLFQTYTYYIIYPILICISLYFTYGIISYGDFGLFNIIMILIFIYVFIEATESFINLRYIKVTENNILIKGLNGDKIIEFKDVVYVYNLINVKGTYLVLWYKDKETQKLKVVLVRPEMEKFIPKLNYSLYLKGAKEDLEITKFIKEKAMSQNPGYLKINNPRWFLFSISPNFNFFFKIKINNNL